jgi:hypothetical protein
MRNARRLQTLSFKILADLENAHFVLAGRCWRCESWYKFTGVIYLVVVKSAQFNFVCEE